ncbi:hypothetical protein Pelo_19739 [Pelomyxa schiedti]|nr:hypothetical protein Pelo_19739 [Pelomyxa schiedti]
MKFIRAEATSCLSWNEHRVINTFKQEYYQCGFHHDHGSRISGIFSVDISHASVAVIDGELGAGVVTSSESNTTVGPDCPGTDCASVSSNGLTDDSDTATGLLVLA